ncbi:MAG: type II toxin-antitoxin system RelE/ParE family toxin [Lacipirellulaceae bacterium]
MKEVVEYQDEEARRPFADWFDDLDSQTALRVRTRLARAEAGNLGDSKSVGGGVSEMRIDFGPGYRVYFGRDGDTLVVLLGGGTKRRQSADIEVAKSRWEDYKQRKREGRS